MDADDKYGRSFHIRGERFNVASLFNEYNVKSVLDYGCGRCDWNKDEFADYKSAVEFFKLDKANHYDPATGIDERKPSDCVISFDALEHIIECDIPYCVEDMFRNARKLVICQVCTGESLHKLPNGEPCHITMYPDYWWKGVFDCIQSRYPQVSYQLWVSSDNQHTDNVKFESRR